MDPLAHEQLLSKARVSANALVVDMLTLFSQLFSVPFWELNGEVVAAACDFAVKLVRACARLLVSGS